MGASCDRSPPRGTVDHGCTPAPAHSLLHGEHGSVHLPLCVEAVLLPQLPGSGPEAVDCNAPDGAGRQAVNVDRVPKPWAPAGCPGRCMTDGCRLRGQAWDLLCSLWTARRHAGLACRVTRNCRQGCRHSKRFPQHPYRAAGTAKDYLLPKCLSHCSLLRVAVCCAAVPPKYDEPHIQAQADACVCAAGHCQQLPAAHMPTALWSPEGACRWGSTAAKVWWAAQKAQADPDTAECCPWVVRCMTACQQSTSPGGGCIWRSMAAASPEPLLD